jgi:hypothetical protein
VGHDDESGDRHVDGGKTAVVFRSGGGGLDI